jgi:hypothetical protein
VQSQRQRTRNREGLIEIVDVGYKGKGGRAVAKFEKGVLLTCPHEGCGCRVRVEEVCDCPGGGDHYTCVCGAEMVIIEEDEA